MNLPSQNGQTNRRMTSPTTRTLKYYRDQGFLCEVTEKWIPKANIRKDLWGFCDILCLRGKEILAIQACHYSDISKRVHKIEESENLSAVRGAGIGIHVIGWSKKSNGRYESRVVNLS